MVIRPQRGPQEQFLASRAFLTVYGGARGGGKTWALDSDAARHVKVNEYRAKIFRRLYVDLMDTGGVWDEALKMYPALGGSPNRSDHYFEWAAHRSRISFGHMQDDRALDSVQGKQFDRVGIDEAAQFPWRYVQAIMMSTRAGPSRVQPRLRMGCNPPGDRDHWLIPFVEPYLTQDGYADRSKAGEVRWFRLEDGVPRWCSEDDEHAMSFSFIPALLDDNKILTERDPGYESRLMNLVSWERERMLHGNWYAEPRAGLYSRDQVRWLDAEPAGIKWVRYWDQAGTDPGPKNPDPDYTAGALVGVWEERNALVIADMRHFRVGPAEKRARMKSTAEGDGHGVEIVVEQEPAASGKDVVMRLQTEDLRGFTVHADRPSGDKAVRASPWLAWLETGSVYVVRGPWNAAFFSELEAWPKGKKDQVDAVSGGFSHLVKPQPAFVAFAM